MGGLRGHREEQLRLLYTRNAFNRSTAVPVGFDHAFRPVTLSRMVDEGLVENDYLPLGGDSRRRTSHYWLTAIGAVFARDLEAAAK